MGALWPTLRALQIFAVASEMGWQSKILLFLLITCVSTSALGDPGRFSEGYRHEFERFAQVPPRPLIDEVRSRLGYVLAGHGFMQLDDTEAVLAMESRLWRSIIDRCCQVAKFSACLADLPRIDHMLAEEALGYASEIAQSPDPLLLGSATGLLALFAARAGPECACRYGPGEALSACGF
jgi:hypothetical protein